MKIITTREQLLPVLNRALGAVSRKSTIPILDNLLLDVAEDLTLRVTGTDLETQITAETAVDQSSEPGSITLDAGKLHDLVKLLPAGSALTLDPTDERCRLTAGRSKFTIGALPADQFPAFDADSAPAALTIAAGALRGMLRKVAYALPVNDVRYYLNGLMVEVTKDILRAVASDGHRLAYGEEAIDSAGLTGQWIIPRKGVAELLRLLDDDTAMLTLSLGTVAVTVGIGRTLFSAKLITGRYPDYRRVIPKLTPHTLTAKRDDLLAGLRRVILISKDEHFGVKVAIEVDRVELRTANTDGEQAADEISCQFDGGQAERGYNAQYLIDALAVIESDDVTIRLSDKADDAIIVEDPASDTFRGIVMPMRI